MCELKTKLTIETRTKASHQKSLIEGNCSITIPFLTIRVVEMLILYKLGVTAHPQHVHNLIHQGQSKGRRFLLKYCRLGG